MKIFGYPPDVPLFLAPTAAPPRPAPLAPLAPLASLPAAQGRADPVPGHEPGPAGTRGPAPSRRPRRWRLTRERRAAGPWVVALLAHAAGLGAGLLLVAAPRADDLGALSILSLDDRRMEAVAAEPPEVAAPPTLEVAEPAIDDPRPPEAPLPEPEVVEPLPDDPVLPLDVEVTSPSLDPLSPEAARRTPRPAPPPPPPVAPPETEPRATAQPASPAATTATARGALRPLHRPVPPYPESLRRAGVEGTAVLRLVIEADGRVGQVDLVRSSGSEALDDAARSTARLWRFEPPGERRVAEAVPFRFSLT